MASLLKHRKLRVDITIIFILVLLGTTLSIIGYTYHRHSKIVLNIAHELNLQMDQNIVARLDNYLRPPIFMHISHSILRDKKLSENEMTYLNRHFFDAQDIYPQINSLYLSDPQGNFYLLHRVRQPITEPYVLPVVGSRQIPPQTQYALFTLRRANNGSLITIQYEDSQKNVIKTEQIKGAYNPLQRPWFQGAQDSKNTYWFGIYRFFLSPQLGLTASSPVMTHHRFSGVIAADFSMEGFTQQFSKILLENKTSGIIFNQKGDIIAYQGFKKSAALPDILNIDHLADAPLKKAYRLYQKNHHQQFIFYHRGTEYIAYISPYASNFNQNWKIATIVPMDLFIGSMKTTNYYTILFSLLMVFIGLMFVGFAADRISQPIMKIASDMNNMRQLTFSNSLNTKSSIAEVQMIFDALNSAQSALSSFAKYVPQMIVRQLLKNKAIAQMGGIKKPITVLFTDIDNYTATSENMDPDILISHISDYLNEMTGTIHQHAGSIDKYMGDAVMAFWNDPEEDADHVLHACQAVLACQRKMKTMNQLWQQMGKPILTTRFGLNTGMAIVGNLGSNDRLNYTVIGDNVNLAARLETLNKVYDTEIIVSESVYQQCHEKMLFRPLDIVTVRGKHIATKIYELIAAKSAEYAEEVATTEQFLLCELSTRGYNAFHQDDLSTALLIFSEIQEKFPQDPMANFYLKRLHLLLNKAIAH